MFGIACAIAAAVSAQTDPPPTPAPDAETGPTLVAAFEELRGLARPVPFDGPRYRRDESYRVARRARVSEAREQLGRAAAAFLVKRQREFAEGNGRYFAAMAFWWSGRCSDALEVFDAFAKDEKNPPDEAMRPRLLLDWAACAVDHAEDAAPNRTRGRARAALRILKRVEQEGVARGDAEQRVDAIRKRLARVELRDAFRREVERRIASDRRGAWREVVKAENVDEDKPDEVRRAWAKVSPKLDAIRRKHVDAYFESHREQLESGGGAWLAARALALAGDPKASEHFERAVLAAASPRELARVALAWTVFAFDVAEDDALARRASASLFVEDLEDEERIELARGALVRVAGLEARAAAAAAVVGSAWRGVVRLGGDTTPPVDRRARVWLFFAPWSDASRRALLALDGARSRLGAEVIAVVPRFGFGWRVRGRRTVDDGERLDGDAVGAPLTNHDEARLLATFRDAGGVQMPLVLADGTAAARCGIDRWPTAVVVRGDGVVEAVVVGAALDAIERAVAAAAR